MKKTSCQKAAWVGPTAKNWTNRSMFSGSGEIESGQETILRPVPRKLNTSNSAHKLRSRVAKTHVGSSNSSSSIRGGGACNKHTNQGGGHNHNQSLSVDRWIVENRNKKEQENRKDQAASTLSGLVRIMIAKKLLARRLKARQELHDIGEKLYNDIQRKPNASNAHYYAPKLDRKRSLYSVNKVINCDDGKKMLCRMSAYEQNNNIRVALRAYADKKELVEEVVMGTGGSGNFADVTGLSWTGQTKVAKQVAVVVVVLLCFTFTLLYF